MNKRSLQKWLQVDTDYLRMLYVLLVVNVILGLVLWYIGAYKSVIGSGVMFVVVFMIAGHYRKSVMNLKKKIEDEKNLFS